MEDVERTFGQISRITWRSIWNQLKIAHANNFKVNENLILTRDLKFRRVGGFFFGQLGHVVS